MGQGSLEGFGSTLECDLTPVVHPDILSRFTHTQNQIIVPKIMRGRVIKIHATQSRIGIVQVKKFHSLFLTKRDKQMAQMHDPTMTIKPFWLEQQLKLSIRDLFIEFHNSLHLTPFKVLSSFGCKARMLKGLLDCVAVLNT